MVCRVHPGRSGSPCSAMKRVLLADIGGTLARFAVLSGHEFEPVRSFDVRAHGSIGDAIEHFLAAHGGSVSVSEAILAVAAPVEDGRCTLTNSGWVVDSNELKRRFGFLAVRFLNDHEAAAWGLGRLEPSDTVLIGPDTPSRSAPMALLGPGTGLGMACFLPGSGRGRAVVSEGGSRHPGRDHRPRGGPDRRPASAIRACVGGTRPVGSRVGEPLSGGRENKSLREQPSKRRARLSMAPASRAARRSTRSAPSWARLPATSHCSSWRGAASSSRAASFRGSPAVRTDFRERFEAKGRFQGYLATIPVRIITRPDPAFLGLAALGRDKTAAPDASPARD